MLRFDKDTLRQVFQNIGKYLDAEAINQPKTARTETTREYVLKHQVFQKIGKYLDAEAINQPKTVRTEKHTFRSRFV